MNRVVFSSVKQDWTTPPQVYADLHAEFNFDHDACPPDALLDGCAQAWGKLNFVNPPYSDIARWVEKAHDEWRALTPHKPLFGQRCGKTAKTHWIVFMKPVVA